MALNVKNKFLVKWPFSSRCLNSITFLLPFRTLIEFEFRLKGVGSKTRLFTSTTLKQYAKINFFHSLANLVLFQNTSTITLRTFASQLLICFLTPSRWLLPHTCPGVSFLSYVTSLSPSPTVLTFCYCAPVVLRFRFINQHPLSANDWRHVSGQIPSSPGRNWYHCPTKPKRHVIARA